MGFLSGIWMFVLGVLAVPSLIIAKRPEAKDLIDKITPYQGWIGAISALWGIWEIIDSLMKIGWLGDFPIWWITYLATGIIQLCLGLLLGIGVLKTFITSPQAQEKMDQTVKKLAPYQGNLGIAAMCVGIWMIIATIILL
ncbi:hypothetical protein GF402_02730 [Candidatus Fermentibacteria bacterium]|nr:hypothetical protein [Candidatus Fermentibacteria bacterium]